MKKQLIPIKVEVFGETIKVFRIDNSVNGAPRYVVHFLDLGLNAYVSNNKTAQAGLKKYTGKLFGGGYVFESYYLKETLEHILRTLHSK